jgi:hypothetical protein
VSAGGRKTLRISIRAYSNINSGLLWCPQHRWKQLSLELRDRLKRTALEHLTFPMEECPNNYICSGNRIQSSIGKNGLTENVWCRTAFNVECPQRSAAIANTSNYALSSSKGWSPCRIPRCYFICLYIKRIQLKYQSSISSALIKLDSRNLDGSETNPFIKWMTPLHWN